MTTCTPNPYSTPDTPRETVDKCPGVARPFVSADGAIVRVRTGGAPVPVTALRTLSTIDPDQGPLDVHLTCRTALQVRGLPNPVPESIRARTLATGLVPQPSHELVRNFVTSPMSGLDDETVADIRPLVRSLDAQLCALPEAGGLPGRFLFVIDDGRGDVIGEVFDLGYLATSAEGGLVLAATGDRDRLLSWSVPADQAASKLVELAADFLRQRAAAHRTAWHVRELAGDLGLGGTPVNPQELPARPPITVGAHGAHLVVGIRYGELGPVMIEALAQVTDTVIVTPWRSLVLPNTPATQLPDLAAAGFLTDPDDIWNYLHACPGAPSCRRSLIDTRGLAAELAPQLRTRRQVHISGCDRACGMPYGDFVELLAPRSTQEALDLVGSTT